MTHSHRPPSTPPSPTSPPEWRFTTRGQSMTAEELLAQAHPPTSPRHRWDEASLSPGTRSSQASASGPKARRTRTPAAFHKGWRVLGHAPGRLEQAERAFRALADSRGRSTAFDAQAWRRNARKTPVNLRPYALQDAAEQCADLARRAGWLDVIVEPIARAAP